MDFLLRTDSRNDLDLTNGEITFVTGAAAVAQRVQMKLQSFFGESVYQQTGGTPWIQLGDNSLTGSFFIFENVNDPVGNARAILAEVIRTVEGVDSIVDLSVDFNRSTRVATVTGKAKTTDEDLFTFGAVITP